MHHECRRTLDVQEQDEGKEFPLFSFFKRFFSQYDKVVIVFHLHFTVESLLV